MRLIDGEKLSAEIANLRSDLYGYADYNAGIDDAEYKVDSAPTVDAAPVVHGRWDERPVNVQTPTTDYFCSRCNFPAWNIKYNYCPNCGARMDLKGSDKQ